ncbi:hypothetical protein Strain138_001177 [Pseudogemmatithrix spongiicola]|uniref:Uncharacterized protein n=1 Tax=Pseudogemmatithrix spongiicola TaxID=3062599 RepID=A0AA49Q6R6_9BACT|nr:hypothetical protein [Gemmatimonas sp. UBA7669]WKW11908.1 hypothetical protein Strain138_001177 [Gemmatimonadaceae bacterium 'strain 138']WKW14818.1 hypothetical protein Strain318_001177 [Gemmatimonadaceae bacterium 'strain 318']
MAAYASISRVAANRFIAERPVLVDAVARANMAMVSFISAKEEEA